MDLKAMMRAQGKALPAHPALLDRSTPLVYREQGNGRKKPELSKRAAHQHLQAYGGSEAIDWVMDCVRLIAETASNANWHFEQDGVRLANMSNPSNPTGQTEADPLLVKLFNEPNPYMDWTEHIELTLIDYLLVGDAYWLKYKPYDEAGKKPLAHYRLAPQYVRIVPGPFGIEGYIYDVPGADPLELPVDSVVHFRNANPHDPYYGLGIIAGGARPMDMEIALTDTQASYFEKHATPSLVVQSDRRVPTDVKNKLKSQLRAFYGGSRNAGEIMVLEAGLKATTISPSATEAAFETLTKMSRDRILAMFRVHKVLLGIQEAGDLKINEAQRVFDTKTMRPLLDKIQRTITRQVTKPGWGLDFVIDYEYVMPIEDRIKLTSTFASIPGVRLREVREYAGLDPLGDERDEWVLNLPGEDATEDDHDGGLPDRNLAGEAGRPPNGENTARFPDAAQVSVKAMSALDRIKAAESKAFEREVPGDFDAKVRRPTDALADDREGDIDELVRELVGEMSRAATGLERGLLDALEGKAGNSVYQRIRNSSAWQTFESRLETAIRAAAARAAQSAVIHQGREGRVPDEEVDYDEVASRVLNISKSVSTFRNEVAQRVLKLQRKGALRDEIESAVRSSIAGFQNRGAETIALTDLTHAYNEGTITVGELMGVTEFDVFDGVDHDDDCRNANGQVWDVAQARDNLSAHPRCRRAFQPRTA